MKHVQVTTGRIHTADRERIDEMVAFVRSHDDRGALARALPGLRSEEREMFARHARFAHGATVIFVNRAADGLDQLAACGLETGDSQPSVVVRDRLSARYGLDERTKVDIVKATVDGVDGRARQVEIFVVAAPNGEIARIADDERTWCRETHLAFDVTSSAPAMVQQLHALVTGPGGLNCDGGGYNSHEAATILYFLGDQPVDRLARRLELRAPGRHSELLDQHLRRSPSPAPPARAGGDPQAATRLLGLMTGAWATQAIAAAAELSLADHLFREPDATAERLADLAGAHPEGLDRLLRYLRSLGLVEFDGDRIRFTAMGQLLRTDVEHSLNPLARIYGGPFYESFGALSHTVRTGDRGFDHVFGDHHFDYFAEHPELGFDQAMAASSAMLAAVAETVDFRAAATVLDVAGGTGELLARILRRNPHLQGILFDRANVIKSARSQLGPEFGDRCRVVAGDFTHTLPAGADVAVLSRVLHDWDDEKAVRILVNCAAALPERGELLIVERLLPEDGRWSLAGAWDVHMMCNVGGRERTAEHYRDLLDRGGFELTGRSALPLDGALLRASRRPALTSRPL